jgi:hypothetical protein
MNKEDIKKFYEKFSQEDLVEIINKAVDKFDLGVGSTAYSDDSKEELIGQLGFLCGSHNLIPGVKGELVKDTSKSKVKWDENFFDKPLKEDIHKTLKFSKYLLNESIFGSAAKNDVIKTIKGYLQSFKSASLKIIRDRLEHVHRVDDFSSIGDDLEKKINAFNSEYVTQITEYLNSKKWNR